MPTDAFGILVKANAESFGFSDRLDFFKGETFERAGRETVDAGLSSFALIIAAIACWQLGVCARHAVKKVGVEWAIGANESVVLAPLSCTLLAMLSKILLSRAPGSDEASLYPALMLFLVALGIVCLLYTSPSPRDGLLSRMPSSA